MCSASILLSKDTALASLLASSVIGCASILGCKDTWAQGYMDASILLCGQAASVARVAGCLCKAQVEARQTGQQPVH